MSGYVFFHERLTKAQFLGFVLSLAGVLCIIFKGDWGLALGLQANIGDVLMLGSVSTFTIHTLLYKNKAQGFPERAMFTLMMLGGLLITLPMVIWENQANHWSWISRVEIIHVVGVLGLNIFPSLLAYHFWNSALKKVSANKVGIFLYLVPVYTTAISILFLGESFKTFHAIGGLLIFAGVLLVTNSASGVKTSETTGAVD